ncbi:MAG: hypothetical protein GX167_04365 [Firmicutes bacterium]|nr:hypothetical protein [Bacillota bacterium]
MKKKLPLLLLVALLLTLFAAHGVHPVLSLPPSFLDLESEEISREDLLQERYYRMVDEKDGRVILVTGRRIYPGDEYITADNRLYRVVGVRGYEARARFLREVGAVYEEREGILAFVQQLLAGRVAPAAAGKKAGGDGKGKARQKAPEEDLDPKSAPKGLIGVYHTHNAESYVPTDGTDSINGKGGIHKVGDSFVAALQEKKVKILHDETLHLPHDRGAYRRSRVTAEKLLQKGPDVIIDIHRDAGPASSYAVKIGDEWLTQVQLVVGRQNPNMQTVRQFALDLKNTADKIYPNLVKGIFMARGNYNQDLTPTSILIEVGTHLNSREAAQDGAALFADVISYYFYGPEEEGKQAAPAPARSPAARPGTGGTAAPGGINRVAVRNAFWMLSLTAVLAVAFYLVNTPLAVVREKITPWLAGIAPYTEKGDAYLDTAGEYIRKGAVALAAFTQAAVRRGDEALEPVAESIALAARVLWEKTVVVLDSGDKYLASFRKRVEEAVATVIAKIRRLLEREKLH